MNNNKIVTSYWFLGALAILLLNDFVLKGLYGNWFTGKLSDFAGLFIFPLFWTALFPRYKKYIFWFTGLFFMYWKSSHSQAFIDSWNTLGLINISRVVDYSDHGFAYFTACFLCGKQHKKNTDDFLISHNIAMYFSLCICRNEARGHERDFTTALPFTM